jgi:tRNA threonylcarbamoyladenosine modification (KEOPS) complex  Pcc1 subunit
MAAIKLAPGLRPSTRRRQSLATLATLIVVEIIAMDVSIIRAFRVF